MTSDESWEFRRTAFAKHYFLRPPVPDCGECFWGGELDVAFEQASIGFSVDAFIVTFNPPFPNRIKIDVDGLDGAIARGMTRTVRDERVRSVLIEIDQAHTVVYSEKRMRPSE